jgi:hypothetical protein
VHDAPISTGGEGGHVIAEDADVGDPLRVLLHVADHLPRPQLPEPHLAIGPTGEEEPHVVAELQSSDAPDMGSLDIPQVIPRVDIVSDHTAPSEGEKVKGSERRTTFHRPSPKRQYR